MKQIYVLKLKDIFMYNVRTYKKWRFKLTKIIASILFVYFFIGCGDNLDTAVQYDPPEKKMLYHDTKTVGCWMRFRVDVNGSTEHLPWSAFLLDVDGKYYQADTVDYDNKRYAVADKGLYARWDQEQHDKIDIYAEYDINNTLASEHMEIKITGFYAEPAHSFQTETISFITIGKVTKKVADYRDVIMKEENYRLINDTKEVQAICQILYDTAQNY